MKSGNCSLNDERLDGHPPIVECHIAKQERENLTRDTAQGDNIEVDKMEVDESDDDDDEVNDDDSDNDSGSDGDSDEDSDEEGDYEDSEEDEQSIESRDIEDAKRCDLLKILLDHGADANMRYKNKNTADNDYISSREVAMTQL